MKITFYHPSNEMYGADKVLWQTIRILQKEYCVEVILPKDVDYEKALLSNALQRDHVHYKFMDVPVLRRSYFNFSGLTGLLGRFLRSAFNAPRSKDSIFYINTSAMALMLPVARIRSKHVLFHLHEYLTGTDRFIVNLLALFSSKIILVSEAIGSGLWKVNRARAQVLHNGFDFSIPPTSERDRESDVVRILIASRWNSWKGHHQLIEALSKSNLNYHLTIAGSAPIVGASIDVPKLVVDYGISDKVSIVGETGDITSLLFETDLVVVPSTKPDPLPTIAIESMAHGKPVLAPAHGGLPEIISDNKTGWLYPRNKLSDWLENNSHRLVHFDYRDFEENCKASFNSNFSLTSYEKGIALIIGSLRT